jgi:hypothetical protein
VRTDGLADMRMLKARFPILWQRLQNFTENKSIIFPSIHLSVTRFSH